MIVIVLSTIVSRRLEDKITTLINCMERTLEFCIFRGYAIYTIDFRRRLQYTCPRALPIENANLHVQYVSVGGFVYIQVDATICDIWFFSPRLITYEGTPSRH